LKLLAEDKAKNIIFNLKVCGALISDTVELKQQEAQKQTQPLRNATMIPQ
jgi:hypothetical protein